MFKVMEKNIIQHIPYNTLTAPFPWDHMLEMIADVWWLTQIKL